MIQVLKGICALGAAALGAARRQDSVCPAWGELQRAYLRPINTLQVTSGMVVKMLRLSLRKRGLKRRE